MRNVCPCVPGDRVQVRASQHIEENQNTGTAMDDHGSVRGMMFAADTLPLHLQIHQYAGLGDVID